MTQDCSKWTIKPNHHSKSPWVFLLADTYRNISVKYMYLWSPHPLSRVGSVHPRHMPIIPENSGKVESGESGVQDYQWVWGQTKQSGEIPSQNQSEVLWIQLSDRKKTYIRYTSPLLVNPSNAKEVLGGCIEVMCKHFPVLCKRLGHPRILGSGNGEGLLDPIPQRRHGSVLLLTRAETTGLTVLKVLKACFTWAKWGSTHL